MFIANYKTFNRVNFFTYIYLHRFDIMSEKNLVNLPSLVVYIYKPALRLPSIHIRIFTHENYKYRRYTRYYIYSPQLNVTPTVHEDFWHRRSPRAGYDRTRLYILVSTWTRKIRILHSSRPRGRFAVEAREVRHKKNTRRQYIQVRRTVFHVTLSRHGFP